MSRVRPATAEDLPALRAIQQAALAEPWPEMLETATETGSTLLLERGGEVVAYAVAVGSTGGPAYVPEFAVAPTHQEAGHGSRLMDALLETLAADGYDAVRLTVLAEDERAVGFYRAHGFETLERRPDEFESGPGLLLARDLTAVADGPD